jgi:hypothetical protein
MLCKRKTNHFVEYLQIPQSIYVMRGQKEMLQEMRQDEV